MTAADDGTLRFPRGFVNATYEPSRDERARRGQQRYAQHPGSEWLESAHLYGQSAPGLCWQARGPEARQAARLLQGQRTQGGGQSRPTQAEFPLLTWSQPADPGRTTPVSPHWSSRFPADYDAFTMSMTGSTTTTSGHRNGKRRFIPSVSSDSELIPRRRRRRHSPASELPEERASWATGPSVILMAAVATFFLLVFVLTMVGRNRPTLSFPAGHIQGGNPHKDLSSAPKPTNQVPEQQPNNFPGAPTIPGLVDPLDMTASLDTVKASPSVSRGRTEKRASDADSENEGEANDVKMLLPFRRPTRPVCGAVLYTFCQGTEHEFHYRRAENACVETAADTGHTCNRGANRFASLSHCQESCVDTKRPVDACFEQPLFTSCARKDVLSSWWFFENHKCVRWNFPSGGCPAKGSAVFRTSQKCMKRCSTSNGRHPCKRPSVVTCTRRHLRYPFFADVSAKDGRVRCLRSSANVLRGRRCLTGANQFRSLEGCVAACKNRQD